MQLRELARLLRLASPALPVGAYSYSQGLEYAIEQRMVCDEASAARWVLDGLNLGMARFEAPIWLNLYDAFARRDAEAAQEWNAFFIAGRDSAELRAETLQMGQSLRLLFRRAGEFSAQELELISGIDEIAFPTVFSFACAIWRIPGRAGLAAYLWSWSENQVIVAVKAVPLGQSSGQAILAKVSHALPEVVDAAVKRDRDALTNALPGLSLASMRHETQYSRLFRS
ncbi:MAG TPA: urease accessory protein UreF [Burkholderiales bacterium]|nr:urease accessory protein UreF [Burkholderiales bacterium]